MRTKTKQWSIPMCMLMVLIPLACGDDDGSPTDPTDAAATVVISPGTISFSALGDSTQLTAVVRDAAGSELTDASVAWTSVNPAVATVTADGWVKAQDNGTAAVVANAGEAADTVAVDVQQVAASVEVSPAEVTLAQGETQQFSASVVDGNGNPVEGLDPASVDWLSGNSIIATVSDDGLATAVRGGGEADILAVVGGVNGEARVSVMDRFQFTSNREGSYAIYAMNLDGTGTTRITNAPGADSKNPVWSPDGTRFLFNSNRDGNSEIYLLERDASSAIRLTSNSGVDRDPAWSPDGTKIAFESDRGGDFQIYVINADGSDLAQLTSSGANSNPAWSPDGTRIAYADESDGDSEIFVINVSAGGSNQLTTNGAIDGSPVWSPDGTKLAFVRTPGPGGNGVIYVMNADGTGVTQVTDGSGSARAVRWSPDGTTLAFQQEFDIILAKPDGTGITNVTNSPADVDFGVAWRPRPEF